MSPRAPSDSDLILHDDARSPSPAATGAWHRDALMASCLALVLAFCLEVLPDGEHVAVRRLTRYPLPHVCASRVWLGINCPACGLTRSIVHLAHADWRASYQAHRLGWLAAAAILFQIPYRLRCLRRPGCPRLGTRTSWAIIVGISALFVINWLFELATDGAYRGIAANGRQSVSLSVRSVFPAPWASIRWSADHSPTREASE